MADVCVNLLYVRDITQKASSRTFPCNQAQKSLGLSDKRDGTKI
jgi:hypothetical protein